MVSEDTKVKGIKKEKKETAFTDLLVVDQRVTIRYHEKDGDLQAVEVRILS